METTTTSRGPSQTPSTQPNTAPGQSQGGQGQSQGGQGQTQGGQGQSQGGQGQSQQGQGQSQDGQGNTQGGPAGPGLGGLDQSQTALGLPQSTPSAMLTTLVASTLLTPVSSPGIKARATSPQPTATIACGNPADKGEVVLDVSTSTLVFFCLRG